MRARTSMETIGWVAAMVALVAAGCVQGTTPPEEGSKGGTSGASDANASDSSVRLDAGSSSESDDTSDESENDTTCVDGSTRTCGQNTGICEKGTQTCTDGSWGPCTDRVEAREESCDGKDNDCDGEIDEIDSCECQPGDTRECGDSTGACETGVQTCQNGQWGECKGQTNPEDESCDGEDNDCDGEVDEDLTQACGSSEGACQQGTQQCQDGSWGACSDKIGSSQETCNGEDDDCDGQTDEGLTQSCGKSQGICSQGTRQCQNGQWGTCQGGTRAGQDGPPNCDGRDNDCDGQMDEGCDCRTGSTRSCGTGTGQCQKGTQTCQNGTWGPCQGSVGKSAEVCDGRDNDCDGQIDENVTRPCGNSTGQCQKGTEVCQQGTWSSCQGNRTSSQETCDGQDNDCDGQVDELGPQSCGKSTGQCQQGQRTCENGSWSSCQGGTEPSKEMCDGRDNDCDGQVDELNSQSCGTSTGQCQQGTRSCTSGSWTSCQGKQGPSAEICDGLDNDCDGQVDNNPIESEDFEGKDSEWSTFVDGSENVSGDPDHTGTSANGSESARARGNTGVCGQAGGVARDFDLAGDPQFLEVALRAKASNWGRVNVVLKDSDGYHVLWQEKGSGNGIDIGWTTKTFDISDYDHNFKLILGNADDSQYCDNGDHAWTLWADDVEIQYRRSLGFEGNGARETSWTSFSTSNTNGVMSATDDATDASYEGTESARASGDHGVCGTAAGISREYSLTSQPSTLTFWYKAKTKSYGRVNVMLKDSSGWHTLMEKKGSGSRLDTSWTFKSIDLSQYDRDFRLVFGNADDNQQYCSVFDHGWTLWVDEVDVQTSCP